jgi:hypothetical protein
VGRALAESLWRQGFVKVKLKNGDYLALLPKELTRIWADYKAGKTFEVYEGIYTHHCYIKLAEIAVIIDANAESIRLQEEDDDLDKLLEKSKELTDG